MMSMGTRFRITLFGSSHGPEVGAVVEGVPPGTRIDLERIQRSLDKRRPLGRRLATKRQEEDKLIVDSGVMDEVADGGPIRGHVVNTDVRRGDYERMRAVPRPGHADFPARVRYGREADLSGGGIFSGRMTVGLVFAGAIAEQVLERIGIEVLSFTRSVGAVEGEVPPGKDLRSLRSLCSGNEIGTPDAAAARRMEDAIGDARRDGDSVGGVIETLATGLPVGLGEPFFDTMEGELAHALFAIPAVKAVEFGAGFRAARMRGSEHNDAFGFDGERVRTLTNHAGGILGGLSTGMPLVFRVAVKPTSSIAKPQESVNMETREPTKIVVTGRHDPCIVPRAVVVVESTTAAVLLDLALRGGFYR